MGGYYYDGMGASVSGRAGAGGAAAEVGVTATFDSGTNGATVATGDAGAANAWDTVTIGSGNTITYDSSKAAVGANSCKIVMGGSSGSSNLIWTSSTIGTLTTYGGRMYFFIAANPSSAFTLFRYLRTGGTGLAWDARLGTDGKIFLRNQASGTMGTFTNAISTNVWVRLEWNVNQTTGAVEMKLFNTYASTSATEALTLTGQGIGADANSWQTSPGVLNLTFWIDQVNVSAAGYPGP